MATNTNTPPPPPPFDLKLKHKLKHRPKSKDFKINVNVKIYRECSSSSSPSQEIYFTSTVDNFIWEDEDCPEKVELYEFFIDSGIIEFEAQFLVIDMILYVSNKTQPLHQKYKGVFDLTAEVRLREEPVKVNQTESQEPIETMIRRLIPNKNIQKARYKIGGDGVSLVLVEDL